MIFERYVFIDLPAEDTVPCGLFTLDTRLQVGTFGYGRRYLQRPDAIALDPINLPLTETIFETRKNSGIFGPLRDLLPDSFGRFILAKRLQVPFGTLAEHEYFDHCSTDGVGALSFGKTLARADTPAGRPVSLGDLETVADLFEKALTDQELPADLRFLLEQGSSLGGAQPKCPVIIDNEEWVAKFSSSQTPVLLPPIEYATMGLARLCGIDIPEIRLTSVAGKPVYFIKRFDRQGGKRLPFLSALALADLDLREDASSGSYPELALEMRKFLAEVKKDQQQFFRRMVFNMLVRNRDDHLRNHGFVCRDGSWHLSPAYDVVAQPVLGGQAAFDLAMSLGDLGEAATIANALSRCEAFNLKRNEAEAIVAEMRTVVSENWQTLMRETGVSRNDLEAVRGCFAAVPV